MTGFDDLRGVRTPPDDAEYQRLRDKGYIPPDDEAVELTVVTLADFAATEEEGADPLLGDAGDILIPANGDVMVYGDGGAGKTTLCIDLACHLAVALTWLGITVTNPLNVLMIENEGPRPLFRGKVARKLEAWTAEPPGSRLGIVEEPWAKFTFALRSHREALAKKITEHEIDIVIIGPLAAAGMHDAGTLQEVRAFLALCEEVRQLAGRNVTFVLIHHEAKGGKVSGAWEGAGDTLLHVQGMGSGRTRLHVQKARWSSRWHAQTLELRWTDGEGFDVDETPEQSDDDVIAEILAVIDGQPGIGWSAVSRAINGVRDARKRALRDRLLMDGRVVNVVRVGGRPVARNECTPGQRTSLFPVGDPTIRQLQPDPAEVGLSFAAAGVRADPETSAAQPDT